MQRLIKFGTVIVTILGLIAGCNNTETHEKIEVFVTETLEERENGLYKPTGYKKVNAITTIEEGDNHTSTDMKAIEDFYDMEGTYIKTEVLHSYFRKSHVNDVEDGGQLQDTLHEPATILIPEQPSVPFELNDLSEEDKQQVKSHVLSLIEALENQ